MLWWLNMSLCKWRRRFWYSRRMQSFRIIIKSFCTSFTAVSFSCISVSFSLSAAFSSSSRMRILASLLRTTSKNRIHMISVRLETVWVNLNCWKMHHTLATNKIWISQYKLLFGLERKVSNLSLAWVKKILNTSLKNYTIQGRLLHIRKYNFCLLSDIIPKQLMYLSPSQPLRPKSRNACHPHDIM